MRTMGIAAAAIAGASMALAYPVALAQDASYPAKIVKIIVAFPPGGSTDTMTRTIAQKLNESWKQPVIVDNKAGANGMIGADAVAKAAPDGYTLLAAGTAHTSGVSLFPKAPYHLQKDLQLAAVMGLIPLVPVVRADSPVRSLQELVANSKNKSLTGGSGGNGTAAHLGLELFKGATGANIQHIPYKGGAQAMVGLLGGQIDVIFALVPECLPYVKSGKLRALAVTSDKRFPLLPDVPTTSEAGIPRVEVVSWNGLMVPSRTPKAIVAKINGEVARIVEVPEMKARIIELGYQPAAMSVGDGEKFIRADIDRWAKVIRNAGIKAD
jgi:tripartite-type tricarboxylate transporter receptor subunit TctC